MQPESLQSVSRRVSLGERLRARRVAVGLSLQALAERAGCSKAWLSTLETAARPAATPSPELLERLEGALGLEAGALRDLRDWSATPSSVRRALGEILSSGSLDEAYRRGDLHRLVDRFAPEADIQAIPRGQTMRVPLINKVAAGYPTEFTDLGYPARVADEYVSVPDVVDPEAFAARVVGDSMAPEYLEGDVVVFSPALSATQGSDCFVRLERDDETTFKRVFFEGVDGEGAAEGDLIRLQPLNPRYGARVLAREDVAALYPAASVIRAIGVRTD